MAETMAKPTDFLRDYGFVLELFKAMIFLNE